MSEILVHHKFCAQSTILTLEGGGRERAAVKGCRNFIDMIFTRSREFYLHKWDRGILSKVRKSASRLAFFRTPSFAENGMIWKERLTNEEEEKDSSKFCKG